jgi:hypothetical protein
VFVSYTDSDTGAITLMASADYGATWSTSTVATTLATNGDGGYAGWPEIAASGANVAVTWIDQNMGDGYVAISTDYGLTFGTAKRIAVNPVFSMAVAAKGDRIAVASVSEAGSSVSLWKAGSWLRSRGYASHDPSGTARYKAAYGPAVVLSGTSTVAVAWSGCRRANCAASSTYGVDVLWRESSNDLKDLKPTVLVASYAASSSKRYNEYPSVLMPSTTRRLITYTSWSASGSTYRVYFETGKGTP